MNTPTEEPPFRVSVQLTPEDIRAWIVHRDWNLPGATLRRLLPLIGWLALAVAAEVFSYQNRGAAGVFTSMAVLYAAGRLGWDRLLKPRLDAARVFREKPQLRLPWTYTLTPEGLDTSREADHVVTRWSTYALIPTDRYLFLLEHQGSVQVFPRAAFPSPAASQQFAARCEQLLAAASSDEESAAVPPAITFGERRIAVRFYLSEEELRALRRQITRRRIREGLRRLNGNSTAVIWAFGLVLFGVSLVWQFGPLAAPLFLGATAGATWLAGPTWVQRNCAHWPNIVGEQEAAISPLGAALAIPDNPLYFAGWPEIHEVVRVPGFTIILFREEGAFGIPETGFWDGAQADEFHQRALLWHRENVP